VLLGEVTIFAFRFVGELLGFLSIFDDLRLGGAILDPSPLSDLKRFPGEEELCSRFDDSDSIFILGGESYSLLPKDEEGWEEKIFCLENMA